MRHLAFLLFALTTAFRGQAQSDPAKTFHFDETYPVTKTTVLALQTEADKITVTGSNRETVRIRIDRVVKSGGITLGGKEPFDVLVRQSTDEISIVEKQPSPTVMFFGYYLSDHTVQLEVPKDMNLRIRAQDGDYTFNHLTGNLVLEADDATVTLSDCAEGSKELQLGDGRLDIDGGGGSLRLMGGDLNVGIRKSAFAALDIKLDDGRLKAETSLRDLGNYRIRGNYLPVEFTVTGGGGEFKIHHEGTVKADPWYQPQEQMNHYAVFIGASGNARIEIAVGDGNVHLRHW